MSSALEMLRRYLRGRNMPYTPEREAVVEEVFGRHDHFTADDLYPALRANRRPISRASVYQTLPIPKAAGLVEEAFTEGGGACYEHTYGHERHCHPRCLVRGRVEEFSEPVLHDLEQSLAGRSGYEVSGHRLEVTGACPACQKARGHQPK